ncbi:unnamed protein product [Trichobilharzia regenti]|nr:unnamed protein product [Trichobilharzia regenti]
MKSPNMYKCHQYAASPTAPPATLSSSSSATVTNGTSNTTTYACLINQQDYGDYKSIKQHKRYRQTNLTANRLHTVTSSSSLSMSLSPVMSVNYRIKTATTTTNTSTTDAMMTTTATCVNKKNTNTSLSISNNNKIHSSVLLNPLINFLPINDDAQSKIQKKYKHLSVVSPSPSTFSSNYSPVDTVKVSNYCFHDCVLFRYYFWVTLGFLVEHIASAAYLH